MNTFNPDRGGGHSDEHRLRNFESQREQASPYDLEVRPSGRRLQNRRGHAEERVGNQDEGALRSSHCYQSAFVLSFLPAFFLRLPC